MIWLDSAAAAAQTIICAGQAGMQVLGRGKGLRPGARVRLKVTGKVLVRPRARAKAAFGVKQGDEAVVIKLARKWVLIAREGEKGWVPAKSLEVVEQQEEKKEQTVIAVEAKPEKKQPQEEKPAEKGPELRWEERGEESAEAPATATATTEEPPPLPPRAEEPQRKVEPPPQVESSAEEDELKRSETIPQLEHRQETVSRRRGYTGWSTAGWIFISAGVTSAAAGGGMYMYKRRLSELDDPSQSEQDKLDTLNTIVPITFYSAAGLAGTGLLMVIVDAALAGSEVPAEGAASRWKLLPVAGAQAGVALGLTF